MTATFGEIQARAGKDFLHILGGFHEENDTVLMLGPDEPKGFWDHFRKSPEATDGACDAMDRWSARTLAALADELSATAIFPFGGPPYHPFYTWAIQTGRVHESPVKLLVHDEAGLWVSFRGALRLRGRLDLPPAPPSPCAGCADRPCLSACPAGALNAGGYDVPACKKFLTTPSGTDCMAKGCRVRAACPKSQSWGRQRQQSQFHMEAFAPHDP